MKIAGNLIRSLTERSAARSTVPQLLEKLDASGAVVAGRMAAAADTPGNREAAAHIIGIERWSRRRLETALGAQVTRDEYDGYRPSRDLDMAALSAAFAETREQTLALAHAAADLPESVTAAHNDLGELSVAGWLVHIDSHATRESRRLKK